jgi:anti-sigma B factor antagonist
LAISRTPGTSPRRPADPAWRTPLDVLIASIEGWDGVIIATIARRIERAPAPSGADGEMPVVAVDGEVDRDTAPLLEAVLIAAIDDHRRTCLDMCRVDVLDAAGARVLLTADRHATELGRDFRVRGVHGMPARVLTLLGVDHVVAGVKH